MLPTVFSIQNIYRAFSQRTSITWGTLVIHSNWGGLLGLLSRANLPCPSFVSIYNTSSMQIAIWVTCSDLGWFFSVSCCPTIN